MKKYIIILIAIMLSIVSQAQIAGLNLSSAKNINNASEIEYEILYKNNDGYLIPFRSTPVGVKHCLERFSKIMVLNDFDYENAVTTDILLADYVDGLEDYGSLSTSLNSGSSELNFAWEKNGYVVGFKMNEEVIMIYMFKAL